jgi:cellulose 1,4-beta-cellobiosidase
VRRRLTWLAAVTAIAVAGGAARLSGAEFSDRRVNPQTLEAADSWPLPKPIKAQYKNRDVNPNDAQVQPALKLVNGDAGPLNLATVKLRYWFTKESGSDSFETWCDFASLEDS